MLLGKRTRRMVAATLLTILTTETFAPAVTYALTSGPTQPEATSFEPIDTTDMVNLQTGNFTYNIPLIDVPGPEGGYPISLSYHGGVQTNEDASWVGLGWTLNTGAISRNVNGYPDDWNGTTTTSRQFWSGGSTTSYNAGVSIGLDDLPMSVNAGLSFSSDTYQGFGVGLNFGVSMGEGPLNMSLGLGVSSQGAGKSINAGAGLSTGVLGIGATSLRVSVTSNFESVQAGFVSSVGIGMHGISALGASFGTDNRQSLSVGGLITATTSSSTTPAGLSTKTTSWGIGLPTPVPGLFVSLGWSKTRYWTDETTSTTTDGSLYENNVPQPGENGTIDPHVIPDGMAFDTYSLLQQQQNYLNYPDPTLQQGGAFPAFDDYQVSAQGLGGNMRPYQFQGQVFGQNRLPNTVMGCTPTTVANCGNHYVAYYSPQGANDPTPQFRFINDFSNTYQQIYSSYNASQLTGGSMFSTALFDTPLPFDPNPVFGNSTTPDGTSGFSNNQLAGSKYVKVGIDVLPSNELGFGTLAPTEPAIPAGAIPGFTITNESGVKYTFGLPAYSYNEEAYQQNVANGTSLTRQKRPAPYAYTWYLTSITGPDYVDRNHDNKADDGDWGYWVNFEYGQFTNSYYWRNPSEGYNADEDDEWQNSALGVKEIYYLNAVRTRSHVVLFEKDVRADARGESSTITAVNSPTPSYKNPGAFDATSASSMQLSHIYLLNSTDENFVTPAMGTLNANVLDATDVNAVGRSNLEAKSLRVIDFNYDNSLCPGTSNSFTTPGALLGKLTLRSVETRGKGGVNLLPPSLFQYELTAPVTETVTMAARTSTSTPATFTSTSGNFNVGDMVINPQINQYYGMITARAPSGSGWAYTLANSLFTGVSANLPLTTTKNPPYNKDAYDSWGMFKGDINTTLLTSDINGARATSMASAMGSDAWSLRSITTELGSQLNIQYEPDSYFNSTADPIQQSLTIDQIVPNAANSTLTLTIDKGDNPNILLANYYSPNSNLNATLLQEYTYVPGSSGGNGNTSFGCFVTDTRIPTGQTVGSITFGDTFDNSSTSTGYGYGLNYYPSYPIAGQLTVVSVNDATNTIVVHCPDNFLLGTANKAISEYLPSGGTNQLFTSIAVLSNSYGGNLFINNVTTPYFGGGIRVRSLSESEQLTGVTRTTNYTYTDNSGRCSGISSYTPSAADACFDFPASFSYTFQATQNDIPFATEKLLYYETYRRVFDNNGSLLFAIANELPAPGVMYGDVSVSWQVQNPDEPAPRSKDGVSRTEYQFQVLQGNMIGLLQGGTQSGSTTAGSLYSESVQYYAMDKFTSGIGNVKSIIQYDNLGNKLTETDNHYLHDNLIGTDLTAAAFMPDYKSLLSQYNYQGYIRERFGEAKLVSQQPATVGGPGPYGQGVKLTISGREEYPCIATGQTVTNYVNGTRTSSQNKSYDFYSGAVTETVETDAYGNSISTRTVPAYHKYTAMGLGITAGNLNMLTQTTETSIWKVDGSDNQIGLVSATVNTWSNNVPVLDVDGSIHIQNAPTDASGPTGSVWRMQNTYNWISPNTTTGDGTTPFASFVPYSWTSGTQDSRWLKTMSVTTYDVFSKEMEAMDVNGNYSATHMTYGDTRVMLTGSPANFYEIAGSGAEDAGISQTGGGFVQAGNGVVSSGTGVAHTGVQSLLLGAGGQKGFLYSVPVVGSGNGGVIAGRSYTASVWVRPIGGTASNVNLYYSVGGVTKNIPVSSASSTKTAGAWTLITQVIKGSDLVAGSQLVVWCENDHASATAYVDDMRFQPLNAITTAYVYDPFSGELTDVLDNNNMYTRYTYDAVGRLVNAYREKLNSTQFSGGEFMAKQYQYNYSATVFSSTAIPAGTYQRNNCTLGEAPANNAGNVAVPQGAFTSYLSAGDANTRAATYAQDNANATQSCVCRPIFTFASPFNPQTTGSIANIGFSGSNANAVTFTFSFNYPAGAVGISLGTISPACAIPATTMTVPYTAGNGSTYNVTINSPSGLVQVGQTSGNASGSLLINSAYGLNTPLGYNIAQSGSFTEQCPAGEGGPTISLTIPANTVWADNAQDANTLAASELQSEGVSEANAQNKCVVQSTCPFTWASSLNGFNGSSSFVDASGVVTFSFNFSQPTANWTQGVVGTLSGSCVPSSTVSIATTNTRTGARFQVTISPTGTVTAIQEGPPAGTALTSIVLSGSYTL
jgi:Family of unknown function (DUF5977)